MKVSVSELSQVALRNGMRLSQTHNQYDKDLERQIDGKLARRSRDVLLHVRDGEKGKVTWMEHSTGFPARISYYIR